jgi:DNA invertase Pin-like site-specific DNA recombinase
MTWTEPSPAPTGRTRIGDRQRDRLAIVYVRQSSMNQVQNHRESTQLQYGLVEHAKRLGWEPERIAVIDDDLGLSGSSAEGRPGFQRLLGEVALDHVGLVLGVEMSRLARSCKDWYQLVR